MLWYSPNSEGKRKAQRGKNSGTPQIITPASSLQIFGFILFFFVQEQFCEVHSTVFCSLDGLFTSRLTSFVTTSKHTGTEYTDRC